MKLRNFLIIAITLTFSACLIEGYYQRNLPGKWAGVSWELEDGSPYTDAANVLFTFRSDSTYEARLGQRNEEGIWWIDGFKLYTIASDAERNIVKVLELEDDTIRLEMNRGGQVEYLVMARQ